MGVNELVIISMFLTVLLGCSIGLLICNRSKYRQNIYELKIYYKNQLHDFNVDNYILQEDNYELKLENSNLKGLNEVLNRRIKELEEK